VLSRFAGSADGGVDRRSATVKEKPPGKNPLVGVQVYRAAAET
jgi:hypothetical protein